MEPAKLLPGSEQKYSKSVQEGLDEIRYQFKEGGQFLFPFANEMLATPQLPEEVAVEIYTMLIQACYQKGEASKAIDYFAQFEKRAQSITNVVVAMGLLMTAAEVFRKFAFLDSSSADEKQQCQQLAGHVVQLISQMYSENSTALSSFTGLNLLEAIYHLVFETKERNIDFLESILHGARSKCRQVVEGPHEAKDEHMFHYSIVWYTYALLLNGKMEHAAYEIQFLEDKKLEGDVRLMFVYLKSLKAEKSKQFSGEQKQEVQGALLEGQTLGVDPWLQQKLQQLLSNSAKK